jgi:FkbH-like protein
MIYSIDKPLTFIEANKLMLNNNYKKNYQVTLCMSGTASPLLPFLKGEISKYAYFPIVNFIPFGTLGQYLNKVHESDAKENNEVWLLFPWDIVPSLDWRMGGKTIETSIDLLVRQATEIIDKIAQRNPNQIVYIDAITPPVGLDASASEIIRYFIRFYICKIRGVILNEELFSLNKYLVTGFPIQSSSLGEVAKNLLINSLSRKEPKKVIITDLDNTFWHGVAAEDGHNGIQMGPVDSGYKHFIYQSYLCQLQNLGVVVAAVSRNSEKLIHDIFEKVSPTFKKKDFSVIIASYQPKSAQIEELSRVMNLGLDSFVFVDDNPIEIKEVSRATPAVTTLMFPNDASHMPSLLQQLSILFDRKIVTPEDRSRTEKYKLMLAGLKAKKAKTTDVADFLKSLDMKLHISLKALGSSDRALQLINKTNQFNANGVRLDEYDFNKVILDGGRIYTARLHDCNGDHGEIFSCLVDNYSRIVSLVMSCRVFQRTVEHSFLKWLIFHSDLKNLEIIAKRTDTNEPFISFLEELGIEVPFGEFSLSLSGTDFSEKLMTLPCNMKVIYEE